MRGVGAKKEHRYPDIISNISILFILIDVSIYLVLYYCIYA